jgi:hypothetical protein
MAYKPTRRRGPNKPKIPAIAGPDGETIVLPTPIQAAEAATEPAEAPAPTRRRKRADIGGQHLKLKVPDRAGYHRRWVNDKPGRLAMFEELAYGFVSEQGIKSDGPDSRVRRLVGTQAGGAPQYAYLMETPLEEFQAGVEEKEEARRPFEEAIRRGEDTLGQPITSKVQSHQSSIR